jgi:hypothetical protein
MQRVIKIENGGKIASEYYVNPTIRGVNDFFFSVSSNLIFLTILL